MARSLRPRRRVAITGLGLASAYGLGHRALWDGLESGRSAITPIDPARAPGFDASGFAWRLGATIPGLDAKEHVPKSYRKAVKVMARDTEIAVACAALAVGDAGWRTRFHGGEGGAEGGATTYPAARVGCHIGAGLIATEVAELASAMATASTADGGFDVRAWGTVDDASDARAASASAAAGAPPSDARSGMNNLQPLWLLKYLPNMLACHVTIVHGLEGPSNTITCGEASGLLSIGESARVIERGAADASLAGGAESKVNPMGLMRWGLAGRLAECEAGDDPRRVVRPFSAESRGSVLGEGGGLLVLEAEEMRRDRGSAGRAAEIAGFGAAQAVPRTMPYVGGAEAGDSAALSDAILRALADAEIDVGAIDAVIPLGAGSVEADGAEWAGLHAVFGARMDTLCVVGLTPLIGNCVAGHGALAVGVAALMATQRKAPAGAVLRGGPMGSRGDAACNVLVCAGSLGGQAAAIVVRH